MKILLALLALPLTGCMTASDTGETLPPPRAGGSCEAAPASELVGRKASSETGVMALRMTGAESLRWGPPDAVWTMDYREDRVNVRYDAQMTITEITCG